MKLQASLELTPDTSESLIVAFFEEFNIRNRLAISSNTADVEIFFEDKPPLKIVSAISKCQIKELQFAVEEKNAQTEEVAQKEEVPAPVVETTPLQEEIPAQTIEATPAQEVTPQIEETTPAEKNTSSNDVESELNKIAEHSSSFEDFVASVATYFDFNKRSQFFADLVEAACKAPKVAWNEIEAVFKFGGGTFSLYDKNCCNRKVTERFNSCTLLTLIKLVVQYQDFAFPQKAPEPATTEEQTSVASSKMPSMPEISSLEEALLTVDKTLPVEYRVKHVLYAMGLGKEDERAKNEILDLAITAMSLKDINYANIFVNTKISMQDTSHARAAFSTFLENCGHKVKVLDFLKSLQTNILLADEIKAL